MMLDTKRTFDELVIRHASSPEARDRILKNRLYQYVSTSLAGTQEYMAMEKLLEVKRDTSYDLIVLDTPPTSNALDFLDAPNRLMDALDSGAMRWFIQAIEKSGKFSLNLVAKSVAVVLRGIGKLTGGGFLQQMAEFIVNLNDLFGGFRERATQVAEAFRGREFAYVLITTPAPVAVQEALFFAERLQEQGMRRDAFVVNRVHRKPPRDAGPRAGTRGRAATRPLARQGRPGALGARAERRKRARQARRGQPRPSPEQHRKRRRCFARAHRRPGAAQRRSRSRDARRSGPASLPAVVPPLLRSEAH